MLATNTYRGTDAQYFILVGQAFYTSEDAAYAETIYDLNLANLPFAESVPLAKVTYKHTNGSTAAGHAQIIRVTTITATNITISQSSPSAHNNLADLQGGLPNEQYHLTSTEYTKVQQLSQYNITPPETGGLTWQAIPVIKTDGRYLDFHITSGDTSDYAVRLHASSSANLSIGSATFNASYINLLNSLTAKYVLVDTAIETNKITPRTLNGNLTINTYETTQRTIVVFKDDLTTQFYGEISTPSWSSSGG